MKKYLLPFLAAMALMSFPAYAQRKTASDYNYRKAVEAYYEEDDDSKALGLLNEMLDGSPNHLDSRFLRAKIFRNAEKYDNALRDVANSGINVPLVAEWNVPPVAFSNVPPQKWLR